MLARLLVIIFRSLFFYRICVVLIIMIGMFWMASQSQMCLTSEWNLLRNNIGQQANAKVGAGEYFGKFQILDIACILNYQLLQHNYIKDYSPLLVNLLL